MKLYWRFRKEDDLTWRLKASSSNLFAILTLSLTSVSSLSLSRVQASRLLRSPELSLCRSSNCFSFSKTWPLLKCSWYQITKYQEYFQPPPSCSFSWAHRKHPGTLWPHCCELQERPTFVFPRDLFAPPLLAQSPWIESQSVKHLNMEKRIWYYDIMINIYENMVYNIYLCGLWYDKTTRYNQSRI